MSQDQDQDQDQENQNQKYLQYWRAIAELLDDMQDKIAELPSLEALFIVLDESEHLKKIVDRSELSIVYQSYSDDKPEFWLTPEGARKLVPHEGTNNENLVAEAEPQYHDFPADLSVIKAVINDPDEKARPLSVEEIKENRLPYQHFAIIPMRVSQRKNIGAFILYRQHDTPYFDEYIHLLDKLSNRLAFYIRNNIRRRRNLALQKIHNHLLSLEINQPKNIPIDDDLSECQVINEFLQRIKTWFKKDDIFLLLKHPLNTQKLALINEGTNVHSEYRSKPDLIVKDETLYLGRQRLIHKDESGKSFIPIDTAPQVANNATELEKMGVTAACKAWAAAPMRLNKDTIIGYMVLQNRHTDYAFEDGEGELLDALSDFLGLAIANLRNERLQIALRNIREFPLEQEKTEEKNKQNLDQLLAMTSEQIEQLYGVTQLVIMRYTHSNLGLSEAYASESATTLSKLLERPTEAQQTYHQTLAETDRRFSRLHWNPDTGLLEPRYYHSLHEAALDVVITNHKKNKPDQNIFIKSLVITGQESETSYFISPMRTNTHSAGCFILPAQHIGNYTARSIDDLSDTLGEKLDAYERWLRYHVLEAFGEQIAELKDKDKDKDKDKEQQIIDITAKFISQAMYTENLYIALYDPGSQIIHFSLALNQGKEWTQENGFDKTVHGSKRPLNTAERGKTEEIILTAQPILHRTRAEALAWYGIEGHKEHGGNPLASWVGVPILSERGVIGVIAAYHDELDYIFSDRDVFFLKQISFSVSGMLKAMALEEAQEIIIEYEEREYTNLIAQDLTHSLKNKLSSVIVNAKESKKDIETSLSSGNTQILNYTLEPLNDIVYSAEEILKESKNILELKETNIDIYQSLHEALRQARIASNINNYNLNLKEDTSFEFKENHSTPAVVKGIYRLFFNAIYAIIENAFEAIIKDNSPKKEYIIKIKVSRENSDICISVEDNGISIPREKEKEIFEINKIKNYYGLWRARKIVRKMGGDVILENNRNKKFNILIPIKEDASDIDKPINSSNSTKKAFYILEDDKTWQNILSRWVKKTGNFKPRIAGDIEKFKKLFEEEIPSMVSLDIALKSRTGAGSNPDGLEIIDFIRENHQEVKIILCSSHLEQGKNHFKYIDASIDKDSNPDEITFIETIKKLMDHHD